MCGIAGYYGTKIISHDMIATCFKQMHRRGPDHNALYTNSYLGGHNLYLLHSRLSILDLDTRANQPIYCNNRVMISNGELYNYLELKELLISQGYRFETTSDTEVMLKVIDRFGWVEGLKRCEGMWAFALYNKVDGTLLLSRDRFGEKPLYLYRDENGLYFGSEIKYIFTLLERRLGINYNHLYRYLVNGYKSLYKYNETFFHNICEAPPAAVLTIEATGKETQILYWQPSYEQDEFMSYGEAVEGVKEKLIRSVELRLRADVPLAFCMSGGVDSNSIISIAKSIFNYDVHGFTLVSDDERYSELEMVKHAVKELNLRHTVIPISNDGFKHNLAQIVEYHDAPVYTLSYYIQWLLMSKIAEHGYRISISGTAADELLTGYYDHHNLYLYEVRNTKLFDESLKNWQKFIAPLVRNPYLKNPYLYIENPLSRAHIFLNNDEFKNFLIHDWWEDFSEVIFTDSLLRNRMLNELFHEVIPVILHEDDLNAMYYSIENRSPFLDRELFEFCCRIPTRYLVRNGYAKALLRDAMSGIVPEQILWNPHKVGFNAPVFSLVDVKEKKNRDWILDEGPIYEHIRKPLIENLLNKAYLPNSESKFLFNFFCAKVFLEIFS